MSLINGMEDIMTHIKNQEIMIQKLKEENEKLNEEIYGDTFWGLNEGLIKEKSNLIKQLKSMVTQIVKLKEENEKYFEENQKYKEENSEYKVKYEQMEYDYTQMKGLKSAYGQQKAILKKENKELKEKYDNLTSGDNITQICDLIDQIRKLKEENKEQEEIMIQKLNEQKEKLEQEHMDWIDKYYNDLENECTKLEFKNDTLMKGLKSVKGQQTAKLTKENKELKEEIVNIVKIKNKQIQNEKDKYESMCNEQSKSDCAKYIQELLAVIKEYEEWIACGCPDDEESDE